MMNKVIKRIAMLFMVCGLAVSVSFGVDLYGENLENYQKLKAEIEEYAKEYGDVGECKWDEDKKTFLGENVDWRLCKAQKVVLFFDEIRAMKVKKNDLNIAIQKVREMPLFKNDGDIYAYAKNSNLKIFWEHWMGYGKWDELKRGLRMDGARSGYWKKLAE